MNEMLSTESRNSFRVSTEKKITDHVLSLVPQLDASPHNTSDFEILWNDEVDFSQLRNFKAWQTCNQLAGMPAVSKKSNLSKVLSTRGTSSELEPCRSCLSRSISSPISFTAAQQLHPITCLLPNQPAMVKRWAEQKSCRFVICKPSAMCQGRGIELRPLSDFAECSAGPDSKSPCSNPPRCWWCEKRDDSTAWVVQPYLSHPLLLSAIALDPPLSIRPFLLPFLSRKFDLRLYILILPGVDTTGERLKDTLHYFLHTDGFLRFAANSYTAPTQDNLSSSEMHLTNYAVNQGKSEEFTVIDDRCTRDKMELSLFRQILESCGCCTDCFFSSIRHLFRQCFSLAHRQLVQSSCDQLIKTRSFPLPDV